MSDPHEPADIQPRTILGVAASLVMVVSIAAAALYWLYPRAPDFEPAPQAWAKGVRGGPPLQRNPQADWDELHRQQRQLLDSYGWIDRSAGIAHIPIQQAMRLLPQSRPEVVIEAEEGAK